MAGYVLLPAGVPPSQLWQSSGIEGMADLQLFEGESRL